MKSLPTLINVGCGDVIPVDCKGSDVDPGVYTGHYDAAADRITLNARAGTFQNYATLFEIVLGIAQVNCKAAGDIKRLVGDDYLHRVSHEAFCILAMSGLIVGISAAEAQQKVEALT